MSDIFLNDYIKLSLPTYIGIQPLLMVNVELKKVYKLIWKKQLTLSIIQSKELAEWAYQNGCCLKKILNYATQKGKLEIIEWAVVNKIVCLNPKCKKFYSKIWIFSPTYKYCRCYNQIYIIAKSYEQYKIMIWIFENIPYLYELSENEFDEYYDEVALTTNYLILWIFLVINLFIYLFS